MEIVMTGSAKRSALCELQPIADWKGSSRRSMVASWTSKSFKHEMQDIPRH